MQKDQYQHPDYYLLDELLTDEHKLIRDAVRAYYMLVTVNPTSGSYYNIGGTHSCTIEKLLKDLINLSTIKHNVKTILLVANVAFVP